MRLPASLCWMFRWLLGWLVARVLVRVYGSSEKQGLAFLCVCVRGCSFVWGEDAPWMHARTHARQNSARFPLWYEFLIAVPFLRRLRFSHSWWASGRPSKKIAVIPNSVPRAFDSRLEKVGTRGGGQEEGTATPFHRAMWKSRGGCPIRAAKHPPSYPKQDTFVWHDPALPRVCAALRLFSRTGRLVAALVVVCVAHYGIEPHYTTYRCDNNIISTRNITRSVHVLCVAQGKKPI